jgi:hypothetical protein
MKKAPRNRKLLDELRDTRARLVGDRPAPEPVMPATDLSPTSSEPRLEPMAPATSELPTSSFPWPDVLLRQLGPGRWEAANLIAAMAAVLPPDFPEIRLGDELICPRGCYRAIERIAKGVVVRLHLSSGSRDLSPVRVGHDYERWLTYFKRRASSQAESAATQMLCSELIEHLESFADFNASWIKTINPTEWTCTTVRPPDI